MKLLIFVSILAALVSIAKADDSAQCQLVNNQYTASCATKLTTFAETSPVIALFMQAYEKQYFTYCTIIPASTTMTAADGESTGMVEYVCNDGHSPFTVQLTGEALVKTDNTVTLTVQKTEPIFVE